MSTIEATIRELGGVATMAELLRAKHDEQHIRLWAEYGRIVRIRKGWYANREVDEAVIRARRVGGTLACMSALAHYGWCEPEPGLLHVSVPRSASRLRSAIDPRRASGETVTVILHWSRYRAGAGRQAVTLSEAIAQAHRCGRNASGDTL